MKVEGMVLLGKTVNPGTEVVLMLEQGDCNTELLT